jgi:hypothetical protein
MSLKPSQSFLKVIGLLLIFTITPATLYLMYYRTGGPSSKKELKLQKNLRYAFMQGTETVDLAPLTEWPWVKVCAVTNGISHDDLNAVVGFPYKDYDQLFWLNLSQDWTLLFIDSEREANWGPARPVVPVRIPRRDVADLALPAGAKGTCVDRDTGGLILTRRADAPIGTSPVTVRLGKRAAS